MVFCVSKSTSSWVVFTGLELLVQHVSLSKREMKNSRKMEREENKSWYKHKDDRELEIVMKSFACNTNRLAQKSTFKWMGMVKNMPHQLCFTWPTNMVYRGMKKGETEPQEKQKWLQRNKARSQSTMSQCLAFSIVHSFAGQHPLFKSILERVRCLRGNTSMEAQDQIWMRKAVSA